MKLLITGGAGFIGSALVRHVLRSSSHRVVNIDRLTYAANRGWLDTLADEPRHLFECVDICDSESVRGVLKRHAPDAIIHLAAESNVDRSIVEHEPFLHSNIVGTTRLLDEAGRYFHALTGAARENFRFLHVSTDEVYGSRTADRPAADEATAYAPGSPYSASKAAADHMVHAWARTYGLPTLVTHSCNNYGPYQQPDKLVPLALRNALAGHAIPIYGDGRQRRDWLHVDDHVRALLVVLERGRIGERYNIAPGNEIANLALVQTLCRELHARRPADAGHEYEGLISFVADRAGHDERYGIQACKIRRELGWRPSQSLQQGLAATVQWYLAHQHWLESFPSPAHEH
ncbi:dTDP-glucose 4,6-dehydratase [Salinisphaera sp. T31B1]|uniref:dTDP-glucose 4,6-dehydratase n=1 Tax=Salinisphaera sp. T31B1 TaxID=727963 RepID=UPI00333E9581